jgi:hypothetical protein
MRKIKNDFIGQGNDYHENTEKTIFYRVTEKPEKEGALKSPATQGSQCHLSIGR